MNTKKENSNKKIKVALYPRVSSHEQVDGYSIGEQIEKLTKYCEAMGWEIYKIYTDPGYTGSNTDRPGLQAMLTDTRAGKFEKVVVYKLDRLSRSQKDTMLLIEDEFLAHGVDFVSMSENFDTSTPFGRAMIGILAVFAQLERENIKERTTMGKEARAKEGKWGGGSSEPIGYDYDPVTELLTVNEYEKMQILEAVDLFLKGTPLRTIENIFHKKGYTYIGTSGKKSEWSPQRFKYVFRSKLYQGYISYRGEWFKGEHEPIIDEETHEKLVKLLDQRKEMYANHKKRCSGFTTYLGGMLYCKQCHGRYAKQAGKKWKDNAAPVYYSCYSRNKKVPKMVKDPNCHNKNWRMEVLDEIVFDEIRKLASDPEYLDHVRNQKEKSTDEPNKIDIIKSEIEKVDEQISRFMDLYGAGTFTIDQVASKVDPLNAQKKILEKELEQLNAETGAINDAEVYEILSESKDILSRGDFDEIRLMLESLIYYIELDEEKVYIHWKFA